MIRHQQGNEYFLFTQDDHARLSGQIAEFFGNGRFAQPQPRQSVINGITMHDSGWPLHDLEPTLNDSGIPLHVFETPVQLAVRVWAESVRRAQQSDVYAGFLVSLHVFALSALMYQHYADPNKRREHAKILFELNKFQQLQIETQETIRRSLGMRTDVALQLGLAPLRSGGEEDRLRFNYHLLRAMDQISLALLCGGRPFSTIEDFSPQPSADPLEFRINYPTAWMVTIAPWPFSMERMEFQIPFRRVPARTYADNESFRKLYDSAAVEMQVVRVQRMA